MKVKREEEGEERQREGEGAKVSQAQVQLSPTCMVWSQSTFERHYEDGLHQHVVEWEAQGTRSVKFGNLLAYLHT